MTASNWEATMLPDSNRQNNAELYFRKMREHAAKRSQSAHANPSPAREEPHESPAGPGADDSKPSTGKSGT